MTSAASRVRRRLWVTLVAVVALVIVGATVVTVRNLADSGGSSRRPAASGQPQGDQDSVEVRFPEDANITNVAAAPYNAKGDGKTDDTAAIQRAIQDNDCTTATYGSSPKTVYLPEGTYLVSDSIAADSCGVRLVGAGRDKTTIRLKDEARDFDDTEKPKIVLKSGNRGSNNPTGGRNAPDRANTGFGNYFQHFTLEIGQGNPGAIGIRYDVANHGAMQYVDIISSDPDHHGKYGLFFTTSPGPGLIQNVTIDGFDSGIYLEDKITNDLMFEDVLLRNQLDVGITNATKNIVVEGLTTEDVPTAIRTTDPAATVMVFDSNLDGKGSGPAIDIRQKGLLYARNVTASNYTNIVTVEGEKYFAGSSSLREWSTHDYRVGHDEHSWTEDNGQVGLGLPIKKAPEFWSTDLSTWANVTSFGATPDVGTPQQEPAGRTGRGDRSRTVPPRETPPAPVAGDDDAPAIQKAIDSGKETIYFPYGTYTLKSPVVIRGAVRKIDFFFSRLESLDPAAKISVGDVNGDAVIMENVSTNLTLEQNGPDAVVIRNINPSEGQFTTGPKASGDLFIENAGAHAQVSINRPINVWGRSIDRARTEWINSGGTLWLAASNIETRWSPSHLTDGSKTEIIGGALDNLGEVYDVSQGPAIDVRDSYLSIVMPGTLRNGGTWGYVLRDINPSGNTDLYAADLVTLYSDNRGDTRVLLPLYVTPGYR